MEENTKKERAPKKNLLKNLKAEFNKIVWPGKDSLMKQTAAVFAVAISLSVVIALLDMVVKFGLGFIIK